MRTTTANGVAAIILALESLAILALVAWQIGALMAGDTDSVVSALALLALTAVGAVAVLAFAVATWRGQSWGRSGGIVTQLLIMAVALGAVTGSYAHPWVGAALALPSLGCLVALVLAARAAARHARSESPE